MLVLCVLLGGEKDGEVDFREMIGIAPGQPTAEQIANDSFEGQEPVQVSTQLARQLPKPVLASQIDKRPGHGPPPLSTAALCRGTHTCTRGTIAPRNGQ